MWKLFYITSFWDQYLNLRRELARIKEKEPDRLKGHPKAVLFLDLVRVLQAIKADPEDKQYRLDDELGPKHTDWRRAKKRLPDRYRLFFKFFSAFSEIYIAWLNDENTLRKEGAKTDCYTVFRRMLDSGKIPSDRAALLRQSIDPEKVEAN